MKKGFLLTAAMACVLALAACGADTTDAASENLVYGTATLTYAEFFSGDVSSTDSFDAVSSATTSKYEIMPNMDTDFVDETANADGYHITGVKNVNVAVSEADYEAYQACNPTFVPTEGEAPAQYKVVTMEDGAAVYSETHFNIADTVTDATAELVTGGTWGDYQINVTDGAAAHLRNSREDEFDINSEIQGIILETESGLKVGMEHMQSIWVQPYEVSFNVLDDNTHNTTIAAYDNLTELSKLVGETVTKITYIMPNAAYVYEFDGHLHPGCFRPGRFGCRRHLRGYHLFRHLRGRDGGPAHLPGPEGRPGRPCGHRPGPAQGGRQQRHPGGTRGRGRGTAGRRNRHLRGGRNAPGRADRADQQRR